MQESAESLKRKHEALIDPPSGDSVVKMEGTDQKDGFTTEAETGAGASRLVKLRSSLKTGLCYDVRMRYHARLNANADAYNDLHPEDPRRTFRIYKMLADSGLIDDPKLIGSNTLGGYMEKVPVIEAAADQLLLVHSQEHLDFIASTASMETAELVELSEVGDSIYVNNDSHMAAKLSCGGAIAACRAVVEERVKNALALIRPPGHHAEPETPGGFCLFSNVSVAAKVMLQEYPEIVKRVVIVDWDVHHGNGTQKSFYDDPRVLYISLHRYERGVFYPGTKYGGMDKVGAGPGLGYNVNIPWDKPGAGDVEYMTAFNKIVMPICAEFEPSLVIISAGFDAAHGDPIGGCHVSESGYGYMTHSLMSLAGGKLVVCLEGGYNLDAISISATAVARVLLGEPPVPIKFTPPLIWAMEDIDNVIAIQSTYWKTFGHKIPHLPSHDASSVVATEDNTQKDHETEDLRSLYHAVRSAEVRQLIELHKFIRLPLVYDKQVFNFHPDFVVTSDQVYAAEKLLLIFHDGPQVWINQESNISGIMDPSQAVVVNPLNKYIQWALDNQYGVVDISVPTERSQTARAYGYSDVQELAIQLWDSAIEHYAAKELVILGIGDAYAGAVHLYGHRDLRSRCNAFVAFLETTPLRPLLTAHEDGTIGHFFNTSMIYTSTTNKCWESSSNSKKPRKKFGNVIRAHTQHMHEMISENFDASIKFISGASNN